MPKRDAEYMDGQREAIARAALEVLLEKGVYETSLRDICRAAGISNGALYTHFATRDEVIVAACELQYFDFENVRRSETWEEYVQSFGIGHQWHDNRALRRFRLSLQFVAEIMTNETSPAGLANIFQIYSSRIGESLEHLNSKGIISMPLGVQTTTDLHWQIAAGSNYHLAANREKSPQEVIVAFEEGLALTAGLINDLAGICE